MEILYILIIGIFLAIILEVVKVRNSNKRPKTFLESEAERVIFNNAEELEGWSSQGRSFTRGIAMITDKDGNRKLIAQSKLADGGIAF